MGKRFLRSITLPDLSALVPLRRLTSLDIKLGGTRDVSLLPQVGHQQVEAAKPKIAGEDAPNLFRLSLIDGDFAILGVIAERRHAADPQPLALGGGDLVANALGGDLPLELGKRQQHIQGQSPHRGGRIELLGD